MLRTSGYVLTLVAILRVVEHSNHLRIAILRVAEHNNHLLIAILRVAEYNNYSDSIQVTDHLP